MHHKLNRAELEILPGLLKGHRSECQRRLDNLKEMKQKRNDPISGLDLERQLCCVARRAGIPEKKLHIFRGLATLFNESFNPGQKRLLFGLLSDIEENVPWTGIDWGRVVRV